MSLEDRHAWETSGPEEVAERIWRIPLPLIGDSLAAVNVYAILTADAVTLVDSGWRLGGSLELLSAALESIGSSLDRLDRIVVSHVHRDHYELGVELQRDHGVHLMLGAGEKESVHSLIDRPAWDSAPMHHRLTTAGARELYSAWADFAIDDKAMGPEDNSIWSVPDSWIEDGDRIEIGAVTLRAVHTPGHTHGHIVFVDEQRKLLFTGDHVLPHITPSIGFEQVPRSGALRDFLASLDIVDQFDGHLMLPAHGPAGRPVRQRVAELKAHHETRLHDTLAAARIRGESTALEAAGSLTWRRSGFTFADLSLLDQVLAVNETLAHLEVLVDRGLLFAGERDGAQIFSPTGG